VGAALCRAQGPAVLLQEGKGESVACVCALEDTNGAKKTVQQDVKELGAIDLASSRVFIALEKSEKPFSFQILELSTDRNYFFQADNGKVIVRADWGASLGWRSEKEIGQSRRTLSTGCTRSGPQRRSQ